ncbi:MAG: glycoside hydrolase family 127 protein, partial [Planctomycetota bacterium]
MNRRIFVIAVLLLLHIVTASDAVEVKDDYPIKAVPVSAVKLSEGFWQSRVETNRKVTIPYSLAKCEESGRIDNFAIAGGLKQGSHKGHYFNDSDVFKVIEGVSYSLMQHPDANLEKYLDEIITKIAAAQEKDGYLYTARTTNPDNPPEHSGKQRWSKLRYSHELYNLGHLYEAAAAHYEATGRRDLLDVATKSADLLVQTFGPNKKLDTSGHEEIEIGLVRLYRVTGRKDYFELAEFFIDQRGNHGDRESYKDFRQDHKPFVQQDHAVGHAVSGAYLYSGAADVAALTSNNDYTRAINQIWWDLVTSKLYITGVAAARCERFGDPYKLPNLRGYNETCAAIGLVMWNHRMFLSTGDSRYIDLLERSLYNTVLAGVSLEGDEFFYSNPL